jgi:hypothetical protein
VYREVKDLSPKSIEKITTGVKTAAQMKPIEHLQQTT